MDVSKTRLALCDAVRRWGRSIMTAADLGAAVFRPAALFGCNSAARPQQFWSKNLKSFPWFPQTCLRNHGLCLWACGRDRHVSRAFGCHPANGVPHPGGAAPDVPLVGSMSAPPEPEPQRI